MESITLFIDETRESIIGCKIKEITFKIFDEIKINSEPFIIIGFNSPVNGSDIILLKSYNNGYIKSIDPEYLLKLIYSKIV